MSESEARLEELQRRLTAALDRIGRGLDTLAVAPGPGSAGGADTAALQQALEDEQMANAQLQERVAALKDREEGVLAELKRSLDGQQSAMLDLDRSLQRLRTSNDQLRANNRALRDASQEGVSDPHLINTSMLTELEALRAVREADRHEAEVILGAIEPLAGQTATEENADA